MSSVAMSLSSSPPPFPKFSPSLPSPTQSLFPQKQIGWLHWSILHMYKHQKQWKRPLATPLPPNPSAGRAACGRGCLRSCCSCPAVLETSLASGLYLEASSLSSLFFRTSSACLSWEGKEGKGQVTQGGQGRREVEGQENGKQRRTTAGSEELGLQRHPEGQKVAGEIGARQGREPLHWSIPLCHRRTTPRGPQHPFHHLAR